MHHDWLIDVLDDMKSYADANRLDALSEHLHMTRLLALTEIASKDPRHDGELTPLM